MAYDPPHRIVRDGQTIAIFGDCDHPGNPNGAEVRIGSKRYRVTCDALELGKRVDPSAPLASDESRRSYSFGHNVPPPNVQRDQEMQSHRDSGKLQGSIMNNEEIERLMNYLAGLCPQNATVDFKALESQLSKTREGNRQTRELMKQAKRRGRLIDIRLALLRWRGNADGQPACENPGGMKCL
jgi:hypothetical protein